MRALLLVLLVSCGAVSAGGIDPDAGDGPRRGGAEVSGQSDGAAAPEVQPDAFDRLSVPQCSEANPRVPLPMADCAIRYVRTQVDRVPMCRGRARGRYQCVLCEWTCGAQIPITGLPCRIQNSWGASPCEAEMICVSSCTDCPEVPGGGWCERAPAP